MGDGSDAFGMGREPSDHTSVGGSAEGRERCSVALQGVRMGCHEHLVVSSENRVVHPGLVEPQIDAFHAMERLKVVEGRTDTIRQSSSETFLLVTFGDIW